MMLSPTENTCWRSGAGEEKMEKMEMEMEKVEKVEKMEMEMEKIEKMEMEMEKIEKMEKMPIWSRLKYLSNGVED